jgi:hypothetical protein
LQTTKIHLSMRTSAGKSVASVLCLALFLFLQTLAAAPVLHQLFHDNAGQADHHCAVTLLAQGQIDAAPASDFFALPPPILVEAPASQTPILIAADYRLLPGRAPPSFLA